jgi:hypothetical protein
VGKTRPAPDLRQLYRGICRVQRVAPSGPEWCTVIGPLDRLTCAWETPIEKPPNWTVPRYEARNERSGALGAMATPEASKAHTPFGQPRGPVFAARLVSTLTDDLVSVDKRRRKALTTTRRWTRR